VKLLFLHVANHTLFFYYVASNLIYLLLLITAITRNTAHRHRLSSLRLEHLKASPFTPPISLLVPAHNEERVTYSKTAGHFCQTCLPLVIVRTAALSHSTCGSEI
jgi:cellulose synthase/poly-beta-1,6-N-acetylglucosamine synthase-like glycosyltransferase